MKRREFMAGSVAASAAALAGSTKLVAQSAAVRGGSFMSCGGITCSRGRRLS